MNDYSRGYFAVQLPMDADPEQVQQAISRIRRAFDLDAANDTTPAAAATPTAPAAQVTPQQIANAEVDAEGLPWDGRIHAGTKTKTQKGIWTQKKGVDEAVRDAVVAELRQQYPAAAPAATVTAPAAPAATVTAPAAPQVAMSVPAISVPTAAPATPYAQLTDWLAKNTGEGKQLTAAWVTEQFTANGTSLPALAADQELSAAWLEQFRTIGKQIGLVE